MLCIGVESRQSIKYVSWLKKWMVRKGDPDPESTQDPPLLAAPPCQALSAHSCLWHQLGMLTGRRKMTLLSSWTRVPLLGSPTHSFQRSLQPGRWRTQHASGWGQVHGKTGRVEWQLSLWAICQVLFSSLSVFHDHWSALNMVPKLVIPNLYPWFKVHDKVQINTSMAPVHCNQGVPARLTPTRPKPSLSSRLHRLPQLSGGQCESPRSLHWSSEILLDSGIRLVPLMVSEFFLGRPTLPQGRPLEGPLLVSLPPGLITSNSFHKLSSC